MPPSNEDANRPSITRRSVLRTGVTTSAALSIAGVGNSTAREDPSVDDEAGIELLTDEYNVSHVFADDAYSLFFGQGYAQARDRLWQMELHRLIAFTDDEMRSLYTPAEFAEMVDDAPPAAKEVLQGFSDGVNAWIEEAKADNRLPAEYYVEAIDGVTEPDPWTPVHSAAVIAYMVGGFGVTGGDELRNARILAHLTDELGDLERAYDVLGDLVWLEVDEHHTPSIPPAEKTVDGGEAILPFDEVPDAQLESALKAADAEPFDPEPSSTSSQRSPRTTGSHLPDEFGSNGLLVHGDLTATGDSIMFGGPSMGYSKPPTIHEVGLHGAEFDVTGVGVPGIPGIVIGRTEEFSWTVNSGKDDQIDTVALELDPDDPLQYKWDGEWHGMESLGDGRYRAGTMPVIAWNPDEDIAWAQRYVPRGTEIDAWWQWIQVGTTSSLEAFEATIDGFEFSFHFQYADADNIAYYAMGMVPERDSRLDLRLPVHDSEYMWDDGEDVLATHEERDTWIVNPEQGYIVAWNNSPAKGWRAGGSRDRWGSIHEVDIMEYFMQQEILRGRGRGLTWQDVADHNELSATHHRFGALDLVPYAVRAARRHPGRDLKGMARQLHAWHRADCTFETTDGTHHPGYAIWDVVERELEARFFGTLLGGLAGEMRSRIKPSIMLDILEGRTTHDWCAQVDDADSCHDVLVQALYAARETLRDRFGTDDPAEWRLEQQYDSFGPLGVGVVERIPEVNRGSWNHVVALGQGLDQSRGVLPPGNSGYITPEEFERMREEGPQAEPDRLSDQLEMYAAFEYKPLPITRDQIESVAESTTALEIATPEGTGHASE